MINVQFSEEKLVLYVSTLGDEIQSILEQGYEESEIPLLIELKSKLEEALKNGSSS